MKRNWRVTAIVRSSASVARLRKAGIEAVARDLDTPLPSLPVSDLLFYFVPPPRHGDNDPRLGRVLDVLAPDAVRRLVYIGTSGVYGDCGGDWVTEDRPLNPRTARARRRAAAEARLGVWGGNTVVLRAPGIYGPGRLPIERVLAGEPILRDSDSPWTNRIHIDDLADCALAAAEYGSDRAVYNAADGHPTKMGPFYREIARRLAVPAPPEVDWATATRKFSRVRLSFLRESRRLSNRKLLEELGVRLRYPDFNSGLAACSIRALTT